MKTRQSKSDGVSHETAPVVKHCVRVVYIKATEWNSTTWESTGQVRWTTFQLGLYLGQQTGVDNLPVINYVLHNLIK